MHNPYQSTGQAITVIVPTRNESKNVAELVRRVEATLSPLEVPYELLFVDDSDDDTAAVVEALADGGHPLRVIHRALGERPGGLAGAISTGISSTTATVIAVIDGDLQHPPEVLESLLMPLLAGRVDVCVGSRYVPGGSADGLDGAWRVFVSKSSRALVHLLYPETRTLTDPGGGLFAFRSKVVEGVQLRPEGFKMLVEILVRGRWDDAHEVPYRFAGRVHGASNAGVRAGVRMFSHLARLWCSTRLPNLARTDSSVTEAREGPLSD